MELSFVILTEGRTERELSPKAAYRVTFGGMSLTPCLVA